jgi:gamma-glutamyltranspeptidase / glutathione hydrolase
VRARADGTTSLSAGIGSWFADGGRMRSVIGNTIVLRDGKPWWSLGSPGNVHCAGIAAGL